MEMISAAGWHRAKPYAIRRYGRIQRSEIRATGAAHAIEQADHFGHGMSSFTFGGEVRPNGPDEQAPNIQA